LCIWANGKSIQLEGYFPLSEAISLAKDLRAMGIEFPKTFEDYSDERLLFAEAESYFSF